MYKFIALLLPVMFLFACSKNPSDAGSQSAQLVITTTYDSVAKQVATTVAAKVIIFNTMTHATVVQDLVHDGSSKANFDTKENIEVDYGTYDITVTGYDSGGNVTASGTEFGVKVDKPVVQVNIHLKRP
jgi:hypothetical protein